MSKCTFVLHIHGAKEQVNLDVENKLDLIFYSQMLSETDSNITQALEMKCKTL